MKETESLFHSRYLQGKPVEMWGYVVPDASDPDDDGFRVGSVEESARDPFDYWPERVGHEWHE